MTAEHPPAVQSAFPLIPLLCAGVGGALAWQTGCTPAGIALAALLGALAPLTLLSVFLLILLVLVALGEDPVTPRPDALLKILQDGGMASLAAIRRFRLLHPWDFDNDEWIRRVAFDGAGLDEGNAVPSDDDDLPAVTVYGSDDAGWEIDSDTDPSDTVYETVTEALEAADALLAATWTLGSDGIGPGDRVDYTHPAWGEVRGVVLDVTPDQLLVQDDHQHGAREWWHRPGCRKVTP